MVAEVIIDTNNKVFNKSYDYLIDNEMLTIIKKGMRVFIPFGGTKKIGYIINIKETSVINNLKSILSIIDLEPIIDNEQFLIADYINKKYFINYNKIFSLFIPAALKSKTLKKYYSNTNDENINNLLLKNIKDYSKEDYELFNKALNKNLIKFEYVLLNKKTNNLKDYLINIDKDKLIINKITTKQKEIIDYLLLNNNQKLSFLNTKFSKNIIKKLLEKEIIFKQEIDVYREININYKEENNDIILTENQKNIINKIDIKTNKKYLIHGVTGSGKTEIYLNLINKVLKNNKKVLYLVPEISLIYQTAHRIKNRFNQDVAIYNSSLSDNEKYDQYRKIINNEVNIILGTRSSVFLPINNLGIIIIDEEHDSSYLQSTNVFYDARDIAFLKGKLNNFPVILGTATPSVETYYKVKNKEIILLELNERPTNSNLPFIEVVPMSEELKKGNKKMFSNRLINLINDRINKKEQIILMLNRRGFSNFVMCRECGYVVKCKKCDVSLTYHKKKNTLKCHYCDYEEQNPLICIKCGSKSIKYVGAGTEQVEEEIKKEFSNIKTIRMDKDTTSKKDSYLNILNDFIEHKYDILIGTQMISKGLDFSNVTLVGVLMADLSLNYPDYRSYELTYQLLTQVSGRSGRREKEGNVLIQVYDYEHKVINLSRNNNYKEFYDYEIENRKMLKYPPIFKMIEILITSEDINLLNKESKKIGFYLKDKLKESIVLGPSYPSIMKIKNNYRMVITIKSKEDVSEEINNFLDNYENKNINTYINVLPTNIKE